MTIREKGEKPLLKNKNKKSFLLYLYLSIYI